MAERTPKCKEKKEGKGVTRGNSLAATPERVKGGPVATKKKRQKQRKDGADSGTAVGKISEVQHQKSKDSKMKVDPVVVTAATSKEKPNKATIGDRKRTRDSSSYLTSSSSEEEEEKCGSVAKKRKVLLKKPVVVRAKQKPKSKTSAKGKLRLLWCVLLSVSPSPSASKASSVPEEPSSSDSYSSSSEEDTPTGVPHTPSGSTVTTSSTKKRPRQVCVGGWVCV